MKKFLNCLVLVAIILAGAGTASAATYGLLLGGEADSDGQGYAYTGLMAEQQIAGGVSLLGKVWFDYLAYRFEKNQAPVRAKAPAIVPAVGFKYSGVNWYTSIWGGWERRNTVIKPTEADVGVKGVTDSAVVQWEGALRLETATYLEVLVSYSTKNDYFWSRGRAKQELDPVSTGGYPLRLGVEVVGQGNKDYQALQVGPVAELLTLNRSISLIVHGGYKHSSSFNGSGYGGIELYIGF